MSWNGRLPKARMTGLTFIRFGNIIVNARKVSKMSKWQLGFMLLLTAISATTSAIDFETFRKTTNNQNVLQGHFVQQKMMAGFPKPLTSNGVFTYHPQKGIDWETTAPLPSRMQLTTQAITLQNQFGQQALTSQTHPVIGVIGTLMMSLFSADMTILKEHFEVTIHNRSNDWSLTLKPKSQIVLTLFQSMQIDGNQYPETIKMIEKTGDETHIRFDRVTSRLP